MIHFVRLLSYDFLLPLFSLSLFKLSVFLTYSLLMDVVMLFSQWTYFLHSANILKLCRCVQALIDLSNNTTIQATKIQKFNVIFFEEPGCFYFGYLIISTQTEISF